MSTEYDRPADLTAIQAKMEAQKIAFSAMTFEAAVCMLRLGILKAVSDAGKPGISSAQLAEQLNITEYGVRILLDMGLAMKLVWKNEDRYSLDKIGHFLLEDDMSQINVNFAQDVCYDAMSHLMASIKNGAPEGLKVFGDWPTGCGRLSRRPAGVDYFRYWQALRGAPRPAGYQDACRCASPQRR